MLYLQAVILGVVQGLAEFLPISSSGHLVITDELLATFGRDAMPKTGLPMNVALHVGTLFSILLVCRKELLAAAVDRKMWLAVSVATVPLVLL
ncbi:MAG: undecaprenyl-diphosphate phosphatase, partial [Planctomycetota bacterium]